MRSDLIINFVAFQLCWIGAVWGAANGIAWLGPVAVALFAGWELSKSRSRQQTLKWIVVVALLGFAIDTGYRQLGLLNFASPWPSTAVAPIWIVAMWVSFALTIDSSMRWLEGKPMLAAGFGLFGGPLAYWVAIEVWGAGTFAAPMWLSLAVIGVAWAVVTPLLFVVCRAITQPNSAENAASLGETLA